MFKTAPTPKVAPQNPALKIVTGPSATVNRDLQLQVACFSSRRRKPMVRTKIVASLRVVVLGMLIMPAAAHAQNTGIAGVVKDVTGAVLPGVTVEATSPALIERVRSVIT